MVSKSELNVPITRSKGRTYTVKDYIVALQRLGIKRGDTICVHSQIYSLGIPLCGKEQLLNYYCKILKESVGQSGTLIMPTFSYSFCNNEVYDIQHTPSSVGILTEHFRKYPGAQRTKHPIFSFAVLGPREEEFLDISWDAFDKEESVYGKLLRSDDSIVLFGAHKGYTFYYLSEQYVGVKHRYFKNFSGTIIDNNRGEQYTQTVPYFVRHLDMRSIEDQRRVDQYLIQAGVLEGVEISGGSISRFHCKDAFQECTKKIMENESYFLL